MKTCIKCLIPKDLDEFHKQRSSRDGHRGTCKECANAIKELWRQNNPERNAAYNKQWAMDNPDKVKAISQRFYNKHLRRPRVLKTEAEKAESRRKYYDEHAEEIIARAKQWRLDNPERCRVLNNARDKRDRIKVNARKMLQRHVREGKIQRQPCEICDDLESQAHHHDYSKPLDVRWLCATCHRLVHQHQDN